MIQIALKKEDGRCVELTLPEQPESLKHQFQDALGQVSHQNPAYIVQAASNVSWFTNVLEEMWIGDLAQLEELNRIAEYTAGISPQKADLISGVLLNRPVNSFQEVLERMKELDQYTLLPGISSDRDLGDYLMGHGYLNIEPRLRFHINAASVGAEYRSQSSGIYTPSGLVLPKEAHVLEAPEKTDIFRVRLQTTQDDQEKAFELSLPASFRQLEEARGVLGIQDLGKSSVTLEESTIPDLANWLPLESPEFGPLDGLAEQIETMGAKDGTLLKYLSVLTVEQPEKVSEASGLASHLDRYERVPADPADYGRQALARALKNRAVLPEDVDAYIDYSGYGRYRMKQDGVAVTPFGGVRKLHGPFLKEGKPVVGYVTFEGKDAASFTDPKDYLEIVQEELPYRATTGFQFYTLSNHPDLCKAVDDLIYDYYGEDNPSIQQDYEPMGGMSL